MQNVAPTYREKFMITIMRVYFHFSEQFTGKVIEKMKNQKNGK